MRERKSRGYYNFEGNALYPPDKRWVYGYYSLQEGEHRINDITNWKMTYTVDGESVGDYTGLKDKDGKEIYEGDIVRVDDTVMQVVFHEGSFHIAWFDGGISTSLRSMTLTGRCEIIGNVMENPELLGVENGKQQSAL